MAGIPQVITEDRASGAQFIGGSLKFDSSKSQYLKRRPTVDGNRKLWTWSGWLKRTPGVLHDIFSAGQEVTNDGLYSRFRIDSDDYLNYRQWVNTSSLDAYLVSSMRLRDPSAYFHYVAIYDSNNSTNSDKVRFYINGQRVTVFSSNDYPGGTNSSWVNSSSKTHTIGGHYDGGGTNADSFWNGHMSQVYFLDGIAAGPEEFGYTDPLTNTWRPKKFEHLSTSIATQYSGASALTWDDNPIGSIYTLSNGNRTATAGEGTSSGYTGADVWSNAIPADSTTAWTLEITNSDSVGGWYFADAQTASGTHPDERGGNSMGLRNQDTDAAFRGTFATANGYSNSGNQLSLPGCETFGSRRVDFVVYRPASGTGKVWVKDNGASTWVGGGNPSNTSSTPSFIIPDGNTYFGYTFYDRSNGDQIATFDGDGSIHQKAGANSFYLPMDGNSPIGEDQSGNGNDWTPVNFGGSVTLDNPIVSGALPILNTNEAGTVAKRGVRADKKTYTVTASGGNYYLDGALKPTLNFLRGGTYIFDYTGATSHPFKFSTTADGTHGGGSEYTDGTNTATSNVMKITVPHNAPDTLYYYCSAHSGMGSSINVTTDVLKADPYAWKCVLATPLLGIIDDVSNQINCTSTTKAMTNNGSSVSSNNGNFYGGSWNFDYNDDYLSTPDSDDYNFGADDYTMECWFYQTGQASWNYLIGQYGTNYTNFFALNSNKLYCYFYGGSTLVLQDPGTLEPNKWHHAAVSRSGDTFRLFIDGIIKASGTLSGALTNSTVAFTIGADAQSNYHFQGQIQDARVYKGVAKYTENFVVGSTTPDVLPDTPSGVSGSSKLTKITEGAVSFDGSGDYLSIPGSSDFSFDSDFTVEAFVYQTVQADHKNIFSTEDFDFKIRGNGKIRLFTASSGTDTTQSVRLNTWTHLALVRESGTIKVYFDGVGETVSQTIASDGSSAAEVGRRIRGSQEPFDGFISNLRVVKGTALYTSDFTPPTEPLTNVTNTKLLCCQSTTSAIAAEVEPSNYINTRIPSGFSWWDAGASAGWSGAGSNTSGSNSDYVSVALPTSGKIYWETVVTNPSTYSVIGVTDDGGNAAGNNGYQDNISGYYFNGNPPIYLAKRASANSTASSVTHGSSTGTTWVSGDILMWAVDCSSSRMWIGRNGTWYASGNPAGGTNYAFHNMNVHTGGTYFKLAYHSSSSTTAKYEIKTEANSAVLTARGNAAATTFNPFTDDINAIRGKASGYATLNPLNVTGTLSDNNLSFYRVAKGGTTSTIGVESGKIYVEAKGDVTSGGFGFGFVQSNYNNNGQTDIGDATNSFGIRATNSNITFKIQGATNTGISINSTANTIFAFAVDFDTGLVNLLRDGAIIHSQTLSLASGTYYVAVASETGSATKNVHVNFGQKPFKFPPPDGFQPLNLSNVQPEKVFARPDQYVSATLFTGTGDGVSSRTVELPQDADLVWAKSRDRASSNQLLDTVRGDNLVLQSNSASNDRNPITQYTGGGLSTIDGKTITIASGTTNNQNLNVNGNRGVIWSWKAGGSKGTFNVDDVGYANASDVNMNVGTFNDTTFLKGQVWSGLMTVATGYFDQPATRAFNGVIQTDPNRLRTSSNEALVTMTLSTPVTVSSQIKVYAEPGYNSSCTVTVDGVTHTSSTGALHTFNVSGSLTRMTLQSTQSGGRTYMEGMEIDGKLLVDDNITANSPSIVPTGCSVGTKQGFSILMYQGNGTAGASIAHGLSETPKLMIHKSIDQSRDWYTIYNDGTSQMKYLYLNTTDIANNSSVSAPTSNVMHFTSSVESNNNGENYIVYMWHDVPGLQKFGTYEGNTTEGAFVELGFRPAIIMLKSFDQTWYWNIQDSERSPTNPSPGNFLVPNENYVEGAASGNNNIDFLSNGFKIRSTTSSSEPTNVNGQTYFYAAWAEAPTVNLYGGHANAR